MWIYKLENLQNKKVYIGQTTAQNVATRWTQHIKSLEKGTHSNKHLQRSWDKHGVSNWFFSVLEKVGNASLNSREQFFIDQYDSMNESKGYNKRGGGSIGKMSECAKAKMARSHAGKILSIDHKNHIRESLVGKNKGKKKHPSAGRKLSFNLNEVDSWIKEGLSLTEIYTRLNITRGALSRAMKRNWKMSYLERKEHHEYFRSQNQED